MQLGISTYTYSWAVGAPGNPPESPLTETGLLAKAAAFGVNVVQVGDNFPLHALSNARMEHFMNEAKKQHIALEVGARGLTEEHLQLYIAIAAKLEARILRFVIDNKNYEPQIPVIIDILRRCLPLLHQQNITLGIENHDRLKAREFAKILDAVGSESVGICLDSVNSMGAGEGLEQIVDTLAPYTVNLHIKDFGIQRLPHLMGFQVDGRPAGKGMLNVPWLLQKISPFARCGTAILEQWVVPENDLNATIHKEEVWAAESMAYLKPYFER